MMLELKKFVDISKILYQEENFSHTRIHADKFREAAA